jgi:hypothetical protein
VLQHNGMERDFSWEHQSEEYVELYRRLVPPDRRASPRPEPKGFTGLGEPPATKPATLVPQAKTVMRSAREHAVEKVAKRTKNGRK